MSKIISEENPAAQQSSAPQGQGVGGAQDKVRKQARQLAYDVRYKVKQGFKDGQKTDPASLKRAFLSQLGKSPAPGPVKQLAKKMLIGEAYDFVDINETLTKSISNAVGKVFVKTIEVDDVDGNPAFEITDLMVKEELGERKYKVRVTDKKSGKSYTRMATRPKISELRKNPNISSVEMTGYGTPYEGEKKKGSQTAAVKSGKGLAKKDYDGDGKVESPTAEYKGSKDKAIKKALHKEEFIDEVNTEDANPQANTKRIDVMKGKNKIKINPNMGEQTEMGTEKPQEDPREKRIRLIKRQILQKKQQAVRTGAGTDVQASHTPEGDVISEKQKDTPDQVKAVIAFDRARKGTDDATYDSLHGKKKQAKKERDYAKWQRDKGAEDAQKSGHPWEHAKGSTREKEGKKSEKHAHIKDDKDWGYDKKGNSLNPADVEKRRRKDDDLFGSPNPKKKVKEDYENEPPIKDQTDKQLASVTFDGGGPDGGATITGTGDPREIPTFVTLIKQKLRARGILVAHNELEGEQLDELNKRERVEAGQGKRAAKKGDWSKQKAKTGRRNINRFETKPVEREEGSLNKGKQSFKKVKVLNPKSGYSKKTDATKGKVTSRKLSQTGTDLKPDYGPQKPHWAGNVHSDRAQEQRRSEHKAKRGVKTKGTAAADIKKALKEHESKRENLNIAKDIVRTILEKDLNAKERRALPDKDFALPGKGEGPEGKQAGSYPIPDKSHARMALAMVAKHGSAKEKAEVRAAVEKKFPGIKVGD